MYNSVKSRSKSAHKEYCATYGTTFTLVKCWKILKDHGKWKAVEMPLYLNSCKSGGSKKLRTSKTSSHDTLRSTHIGLDLNDKAADSEDEEVQEVRPIGWDKLKKI
ncbi:ALP1-like protein isoform X1 [Tanacetum coccineum]